MTNDTSLTVTTGNRPVRQTGDRFSRKNCVTVNAQPNQTVEAPTLDVAWRIGKHRQGTCRTTFDLDLGLSPHDCLIVAELRVMQWLLEEKQAIGAVPNIARSLLIFSGGAPAKLAAGKSCKSHLYTYAHFLTTRFAGAAILAERDRSWIRPQQTKISDLYIDGPIGEYLNLPGIGPVWLTHHLMRQFRLRLNNASHAQAWQTLQRLLTRCSLQRLPESPGNTELGASRHRNPGVRLLEAQSRWVFVMINGKGRPTLTTAYIKA